MIKRQRKIMRKFYTLLQRHHMARVASKCQGVTKVIIMPC